jgi:hypothetical protein
MQLADAFGHRDREIELSKLVDVVAGGPVIAGTGEALGNMQFIVLLGRLGIG